MELEDLAIGNLAKVVVNKQRPCHTLIVCLDENLAEDSVLPVSPINSTTKGDLLENVSTKRTINEKHAVHFKRHNSSSTYCHRYSQNYDRKNYRVRGQDGSK